MPFIQTDVQKEIELKKETDPKFKKAWDESRAEYRLIGEMISLRKQENVTQKELAALTGNKSSYGKVIDLETCLTDSRLTEPSDGKRFRWREMIEEVKRLGRPLTETESEQYLIK